MFYLAAATLALLTALLLAWPFIRRERSLTTRAEHDMQAYRAQLDELVQDRERGLVTDAEAESARIEVSRRLLAASEVAKTEAAGAVTASGSIARRVGLVGAVATPLIAALIYAGIGAPGMPDVPFSEARFAQTASEARPSQDQAEATLEGEGLTPAQRDPTDSDVASFAALVTQLKEKLAENPGDPVGLALLARSEARLGRFADSWRSFQAAIDASEKPAISLYSEMGETMVLAANGYLSPQAETAFDIALESDPEDIQSRYYKGLALAQRGDIRNAYETWYNLLADAPDGAAWAPIVYQRAVQAASELGEPLPPRPAGIPGPSAEDIQAASEMDSTDRAAMIESMVERLAERMKETPEDLEGWLRLFRAYKVLGRTDDIEQAAITARAALADKPAALQAIDEAVK